MSRISTKTLRYLKQVVNGTHKRPICHHAVRQRLFTPTSRPFTFSHIRQDERPTSTSQKADASSKRIPESHYDLFPQSIPKGTPPAGPFAIDLRALKREFLQLQASAHPDRHPPETRLKAAALSARINDAYKTLFDPLKRAQYLLSSRGVGGGEDDEGTFDEGQEDAGILMEVMEAREAAEEAEGEAEIQSLRDENFKRIDDIVERLDAAFEADDVQQAKALTVRLRYWVGVEDRLREGTSMH